jgi:hypothetical protein
MPKGSVGHACLGLPLLYGLVPVIVGCIVLIDRAALPAPLMAFGVLFLVGGTVMVSSALWLFVSVGRSRLPLWIGGIASILNAGILASVTLTDVLPCSGPD